jgi:predicted secreted Zn-dependent protease
MKKIAAIFVELFLAALPLQLGAQGNVPGQYAYISMMTATAVTAQAGYLLSITINGGTPGTVTLYDTVKCSGSETGKFATIGAQQTSTNAFTLTYNLRILNGICVVTGAAVDLTVTYN